MKKSHLVIFTLTLVGLAFWLGLKPDQKLSATAPSITEAAQNQIPTNVAAKTNKIKSPSSPPPVNPNSSEHHFDYIKKITDDPQYDWKQPINFYGRVVDESNNVVAGANVHFVWNDLSPTGTSEADSKSDENGFFRLENKTGKGMSVKVAKEGYYGTSSSWQSFEYANPYNGLFKPDSMNPVVFHLRKKGIGVDLITSNNGIDTNLHAVPPTNGSPVFIDFFSRKIGDVGQLKIEGWKEPKDFKTAQNNWGFRLTVPDGGLVENTDDLPFEAPDADYQSVLEWHFKDGAADWQGGINKKYYIKFGNPPRYGTITVETTAFFPGVYLGYVINPSGSRNLEPK